METDDTMALVEAARGGDSAAFGTLAEAFQPMLFAVLHQSRPAPDDIEDLAQETFVRAFRHLHRLRRPDRFAFWLTGIAMNVVREYRRRPRLTVADSDLAERAADSATDSRETERIEALLQAVARLPLRYRLPLTLHYLDGFDYRRIAAQLGIAESAVKVRVFRAKERLRRCQGSRRQDRHPVKSKDLLFL